MLLIMVFQLLVFLCFVLLFPSTPAAEGGNPGPWAWWISTCEWPVSVTFLLHPQPHFILFFSFLFLFLFSFLFFFWDWISLCNSSGCPGTCFVAHIGLELRHPPVSASQILGLKMHDTTARLPRFILFLGGNHALNNSRRLLMRLCKVAFTLRGDGNKPRADGWKWWNLFVCIWLRQISLLQK